MPTFTIQDDRFLLDGAPFQIISGALHYFRVPRAYWADRLAKARWMGLNTIETYVAWNLHEPRPGEFHYQADLDLPAFVRLAAEHGLYVLLRPGPYICSEWDLGGLPSWLLADADMRVRCAYPPYLDAVDRFFADLLPRVAPQQITRGGPILMVQVENEYGSYGDDQVYLRHLADRLRLGGIDVPLFTSDGSLPDMQHSGSLPGALATVNGFDPLGGIRALRKVHPGGPGMMTEFWDGWFDHWGRPHTGRTVRKTARQLDRALAAGASVNLYMWHGGTNFGFMNGANVLLGRYWPDVSSYDYDAPLSEAGDLTPKYHAFRRVIARHAPVPEGPAPADAPKLSPGVLPVRGRADLWAHLPAPVHAAAPLGMEALGQDYGFTLYRHTLRVPARGCLRIDGLRDRAQVFVDGRPLGVLDRDHPRQALKINAPAGARLDILVENLGRVNFGAALLDRKGILGGVRLGERFLFGWEMFPLPMSDLSSLRFTPSASLDGPAFFLVPFELAAPADTFLHTPGWTKGAAWVNGHPLGRHWQIGPQRSLYVPGAYLRAGVNELVLLELHGARRAQVELRDRPAPAGWRKTPWG